MGLRDIVWKNALKAERLIAIPMEESGTPSIIVGYGLVDGKTGEKHVFYPRYGEQIQIVELLCEKEDYKYPNGEGRHYLLDRFMRLGIFHKTEDIIKDARLPRKYELLQVIRTFEELDAWLNSDSPH